MRRPPSREALVLAAIWPFWLLLNVIPAWCMAITWNWLWCREEQRRLRDLDEHPWD